MQPEPSTSTLLTMEQQFALRKYQAQVKEVSREELEALFLEVMRQKLAQENLFRDMMREGKPF
jgi:hypothetical protein